MGVTVDELAERLCVDRGDILAMVGMYPPDETHVWEEEGVLSNIANDDIDATLNPVGARTVPELYYPSGRAGRHPD